MTNSSVSLYELRGRIYVKAKAQTSWRFWGLYVHVCKTETLREAYRLAKENNGVPGIEGVSFEAIEEQGVVSFVEHLRKELIERTYRPLRVRKVGIPKDGGKTRVLSSPAIRDRVVQGPSSSFWNRSSRRTSNRGLLATDQGGHRMARYSVFRKRSPLVRDTWPWGGPWRPSPRANHHRVTD